MPLKALITGASGQDGSYLAELLLSKGYEVHGLVRHHSSANLGTLANLGDAVHLIEGDLHDQGSLDRAVKAAKPDEIYNLAGQTHVGVSFYQPILTVESTGLGALRMLEATRHHAPGARFYQASSSEMFGDTSMPEAGYDESCPFKPRSPYAAAKVLAHNLTVHYREAYDLWAACGILFNHESPRRPPTFVTRKISLGVARIATGRQSVLRLGNIESRRDWGLADDYVDLETRILSADAPSDYVGATGESHSVREFLIEAFRVAGIPDWEGHVKLDSGSLRPTDVPNLHGNPSKAKRDLNWETKTKFKELVRLMVEADIKSLDPE